MQNLINVGLYGAGTRDSRLRAEYIYCDMAEQCSAYREGKCFCVTTLFGARCGVGVVTSIDGGTKRAKAFTKVSAEARQNPRYGELSYPSNTYVTKIGNTAFLTIPYTWLEITPGGDLIVGDPHLSTNKLTVGADRLTPKNIMAICKARPRAIIGGEIRDYQEKIVPHFLRQFKALFPKRFQRFVEEYPDYEVPVCSWLGRRAKLATCNRSAEYIEPVSKSKYRFEGDWLVCDDNKSAFAPFGATGGEIRVKINDKMVVEITDDDQVTEDTVFI